MAGFYDSVSEKGILNAIGDNPVGRWVQSKYPESQLKHDVGGAIVSARNALSGTDAGAIPVPQEQADKNVQDRVGALQSDVQGMLAPTDPAHNPAESATAPTTDPNSQQAGADAKAKQQAELDKTKQQVADDATKGGGANTPISVDNPAQALATRNQNIQAGVGHATTGVNQPEVPKPLTDNQQKNVALHETGQESFKSMNIVGDWFNSRSFLMGMMQTGLSLLDGKGYAESFAAGSKYFDDHYGMEQRQAWADDLLNKGYDRQEIEQYIETGNSKILTSPEQKAMAQLQAQTQQQQAQANLQRTQLGNEQAAYEQSPEQRALARQDQEITNQYKQNQMGYQNFQMQQAMANAPLERQLKEAQIAQTQAGTQQKLAVAAARLPAAPTANVQSFIDSAQQSGASLNPAQLSGTMLGDEMVMKNPRTGRAEVNAGGMVMTVDRQGQIHQRDSNQMKADTSIAMNQIALDHVDFLRGKNLGATGASLRSLGQSLGFRSEADAQQWVEQYNGSMEDAITQQLLIESGGKKVDKTTVEHAVKAAGKLSLDMSGEQAQRVIDQGSRILNRNMQAAGSIAERKPGLGEVSSSNANFAPRGERVQGSDGNWYVSNGGPRNRQSTWVRD